MRRWYVIAPPYIWLLLFFLVPFFIVLKISLSDVATAMPPYIPTYDFSEGFTGLKTFLSGLDFENYGLLFSDSLYIGSYWSSIKIAALATTLTLLVAYPIAYGMARAPKEWQATLMMLVILPFWTTFLPRAHAWMGLMGKNSWFNGLVTDAYDALTPAAWALKSVPMMHTNFAVVLVMVYTYLPFMILPLHASLERLDPTLDEAAMDLGSRPYRVFRDVTLPQSIPGIIAGGLLVFIPAAGELVIPTLVGDASSPMIGRVISDEFAAARDWPMASSVAVALLVLMVGPMMIYSHYQSKSQQGNAK